MASIETLVDQIGDARLKAQIAREVAELKKRRPWGLVFERHLPENIRALVAPIKVGTAVWERRSSKPRRFVVRAIQGDELVVALEPPATVSEPDATTERIGRGDVLVEQDFASPIFPALTPIGEVRNGPDGRAVHAVIQGENYQVLETLLVSHERAFDVIYLDPPYNTGARDWSYNNDYIDPGDTYGPSKWLAFMERRLRLARQLLKPDGVIVVTIDEHEVHHLGMLLEQVFPEARRQMVSIVINPAGVDQGGLSRVDEYAFFCFFRNAPKPTGLGDDLMSDESKIRGLDSRIRWEQLLRAGAGSERADNPKLFYPVLLDPEEERVVGVGEPLLEGEPELGGLIDGKPAIWPVRENDTWGRWRASRATMVDLIAQGFVRPGGWDPVRKTRVIYYVGEKARGQIASGEVEITGRDANGAVVLAFRNVPKMAVKTVWHRNRHNSSMSGSQLLLAFMGRQGSFPFPKSVYAVRDTIDILTRDNHNALILDFFAGSGTTLHSTALLNAEDGGSRRCFLVTNNEVRADVAGRLEKQGHFRGDPEFEGAGVFEGSTKPRVAAAITGVREDGTPVPGQYFDGRPYAEGFAENVAFFRLDYLDAAEVEFGLRFRELHPLLWLWAGGVGEVEDLDPRKALGTPKSAPYAVLFDPSGMPALLEHLRVRPDVRRVFIVTESDDGFDQLAGELPDGVTGTCLYRDYLTPLRTAVR